MVLIPLIPARVYHRLTLHNNIAKEKVFFKNFFQVKWVHYQSGTEKGESFIFPAFSLVP
mgnify:CR=1 FL=1